MICRKSDESSIDLVVESLKKGEVLVLPTDTVYGFSAIVNSKYDCASKIRKIKGRAEEKPFIQLIAAPSDISKYTDDVIPQKLLDYWPGPLTLIVKDKRLSSEEKTVKTAFRCPGDEWLRKIIAKIDCPIYSTSVNRSGSPVLDEEAAIIKEFEDETALIVCDGDKKNALPSTIVSFEDGKINILRQGSLKIQIE